MKIEIKRKFQFEPILDALFEGAAQQNWKKEMSFLSLIKTFSNQELYTRLKEN